MTTVANQFGVWRSGGMADGFNSNGSTANNSTQTNWNSQSVLPDPRTRTAFVNQWLWQSRNWQSVSSGGGALGSVYWFDWRTTPAMLFDDASLSFVADENLKIFNNQASALSFVGATPKNLSLAKTSFTAALNFAGSAFKQAQKTLAGAVSFSNQADLKIKQGSFTLPNTNNSAFAVSGIGFQPKLVIFFAAWNWGWGGTTNTRNKTSIGFADANGHQFTHSVIQEEAVDIAVITPNGHHEELTNKCINIFAILNNAGSRLTLDRISAALTSMNSDGFTLNVSVLTGFDGFDEFPTDTEVQYLALGGADIQAFVGNITGSSNFTSTGNHSVTGIGFQPKALFFVGGGTSSKNEGYHYMGAGVSSSNRLNVSHTISDNSNLSRYSSEALTSKIYDARQENDVTVRQEFDLVSMDSDGFTYNELTAGDGSPPGPGYIALGGLATYDVGRFAQPASTGNQDVTAAVSPEALILFGDGKADHAGWSTGQLSASLGLAVPGVANVVAGMSGTNAIQVTSTATVKENTKSLVALTGGNAPTIVARGSITQKNVDGFRVNWDTADSTARVFNYLAIASTTLPGGKLSLLIKKALTAAVNFLGTVLRTISKGVSSAVSFVGTLTQSNAFLRTLTGALSFSGSIQKQTGKALASSLSFAGSVTRLVLHALTAALNFSGAMFRTLSKNVSGAVSFVGINTRANAFLRTLTGAVSFVGSTPTKLVTKALTGALSFAGSVTRRVSHGLTAAVSFAGSVTTAVGELLRITWAQFEIPAAPGGPTTFNRTLTAALSFAGSAVKQTSHGLTAALTFVGAVTKKLQRSFTGAVSFSGSLLKVIAKPFVGAVSFTGALTKQLARTFSAAVSFVGATTKRLARALTGAISFVGAVATHSAFLRTLTGAVSFSGTLIRGSVFLRTLTGAVSFIGSLSSLKSFTKAFTGSVSFVGAQSKVTQKALSGALSFTTAMTRKVFHGMTAALTFAGSETMRLARTAFTAAVSFVGAVATLKAFQRILTGAVSFSGSVQRTTLKALAGALPFVGAIRRAVTHTMPAALTFVGVETMRLARTLTGSVSFSGNISRAFVRILTGAVSFVGTSVRNRIVFQLLTASLSFAGSVRRQTTKSLTAAIAFSGSITRLIRKGVASALSFVGSLDIFSPRVTPVIIFKAPHSQKTFVVADETKTFKPAAVKYIFKADE